LSRWEAPSAEVDRNGTWRLDDALLTRWPTSGGASARVTTSSGTRQIWNSDLSLGVVNAAMLKASQMSTLELYRYKQHLAAQEQASQRYDIQFWRKALYPFACLVMMALALPFAYLHARAGGISARVFVGIMLGIGFVLLNNLASHVGLLRDWSPFAVAAAPSLLFLLLSMGAFAWLVRYR
jgi:lipopolysaccharide export system permease protein